MHQEYLPFFLTNLFGPMRWIWVVMGACVGSFLSVVVYRLPLMLEAQEKGAPPPFTLSLPGSACPVCKTPLTFWANLPVIGFLLSKGHCSHCGVKIPARYLLLELVAAGWALAATFMWAAPLQIATWSVFGWALLAMAWMDAETQWLPDRLTLGLLWLGLVASTTDGALVTPAAAILTAAGTYLAVEGLNAAFIAIRGQEGIAGGDAKLLAAFGAWFGAEPTVYVATAGCALFIGYALITGQSGRIAFGPGLCLAAAGAALVYAR